MFARKIIICIFLLVLPRTVEAVSYKELSRIKQNFSVILVPSDTDPFHLKSILSSIVPETEVSDQVVVELHQRYPLNEEKMAFYISSLSDKGAWPDINYEDKKRSGWEPKLHAERILELVKLYYSKQTPYYQSAEVETAIHKALDYWFTSKPICLNWWYNQIGIPKTLGTAFVLFEQKLTSKEKKAAISVMENAKFGMTGQNKVWLAGNVMMRALLQNDAGLVKMARDTIVSEIVTGKVEGIKDDWSFHQHGAQQQFGNYGTMDQNPLIGHKHFWQSDYTIHRRPHWMTSVKMASDRVVGVEMMNGDNMKGFYMADGATYLYQNGDEYLDIFPLWDWRQLPGVTTFRSDGPMPVIQKYHPRNAVSFVGGISNGVQGVSAMEINRAGIKVRYYDS